MVLTRPGTGSPVLFVLPARAVPRARRRSAPSATEDAVHRTAARLRRHLERDGGFTVTHPTGEPVSDGVSVCADPELTLRFRAGEWDTGRVARWIQRWEHRLLDGEVHLGGWLDQRTEQVILDLVVVFPTHHRDRALAHGRRHGQHAVFDLTNDELIPLDAW